MLAVGTLYFPPEEHIRNGGGAQGAAVLAHSQVENEPPPAEEKKVCFGLLWKLSSRQKVSQTLLPRFHDFLYTTPKGPALGLLLPHALAYFRLR